MTTETPSKGNSAETAEDTEDAEKRIPLCDLRSLCVLCVKSAFLLRVLSISVVHPPSVRPSRCARCVASSRAIASSARWMTEASACAVSASGSCSHSCCASTARISTAITRAASGACADAARCSASSSEAIAHDGAQLRDFRAQREMIARSFHADLRGFAQMFCN